MSEDVDSLSAVVVNYRSADLAVACVSSLRADGVTEIVVVDSASGDGVAERLAVLDPSCRVLAMPANRGYGAAANAGAAATSGAAVLICNADLVVQPGTRAALLDALSRDGRLG